MDFSSRLLLSERYNAENQTWSNSLWRVREILLQVFSPGSSSDCTVSCQEAPGSIIYFPCSFRGLYVFVWLKVWVSAWYYIEETKNSSTKMRCHWAGVVGVEEILYFPNISGKFLKRRKLTSPGFEMVWRM